VTWLTGFSPGLNVNRGHKILVRLRYAGDKNQFLPLEQVTDTMLHELSHIVHGPHDSKFHALWNQLRDEYEGLVMKGYSGEGFLSEGHRLGGRRLPPHEARRLARAAAERRQTLGKNSGQRLGGSAPRPGEDIRRVIVGAVERRNNTLKGCGEDTLTQQEIQQISETATRNGFRTQAEEDAANEAAIAQALWEMVQEDEQRKYGNDYIPPSAEHPEGNGGWSELSQITEKSTPGSTSRNSNGSSSRTASHQPPPVPVQTRPPPTVPPPVPAKSRPRSPEVSEGWTCSICTLHNPATYLMCDACGTERPEDTTRKLAAAQAAAKRSKTSGSARSASARAGSHKIVTGGEWNISGGAAPSGPATWQCSRCGNNMESQWWSCSSCGNVKERS